jgi:hypothetical protein
MRRMSLWLALLLATIAAGCKDSTPAPPASVITNTRNALNPFRITLTTDPSSPTANSRVLLKVHVIDAADRPADGIDVGADLSMLGGGNTQHVALSGRGGGDYEGEVTPDLPGSWYVDLTASKDGQSKKQRFDLDVGG